jgi:hypothetical protein
MRPELTRCLVRLALLCSFVSAPALAADPEPAPAARRGPARIEFDDRLVQGQTKKAGAVYLYDRKALVKAPLVKLKLSFRERIVEGADAR